MDFRPEFGEAEDDNQVATNPAGPMKLQLNDRLADASLEHLEVVVRKASQVLDRVKSRLADEDLMPLIG